MSATLEQKKAFALAQIAPYFIDPSTCGYDANIDICQYLTKDGKMCVLGKNLLPNALEYTKTAIQQNADQIIGHYANQSECLVPEAVDILTSREWFKLQNIHDSIANRNDIKLIDNIIYLALFTYDELVEYSNNIKQYDISSVLNVVSMTQIPENALLDGVVKALEGAEAFSDTDEDLGEKIYTGDIFNQIITTQNAISDSPIAITNKKVLGQLDWLAKNIKTEYIQIVKI